MPDTTPPPAYDHLAARIEAMQDSLPVKQTETPEPLKEESLKEG